jgi:hypothetical protein
MNRWQKRLVEIDSDAQPTDIARIVQNVRNVQNSRPFGHFVRIEQIEQWSKAPPSPQASLAHPAVETALIPPPDLPDEWSEAIDRLVRLPCPEAESAERWACACRAVGHFGQQWAAKAKSLGWTFDELFAFAEPFANVSPQGAAWFVGGSNITAVTADAITLRTPGGATQRIYRRPGV